MSNTTNLNTTPIETAPITNFGELLSETVTAARKAADKLYCAKCREYICEFQQAALEFVKKVAPIRCLTVYPVWENDGYKIYLEANASKKEILYVPREFFTPLEQELQENGFFLVHSRKSYYYKKLF